MERHLCSWTAKINSIKISKLPNAIYRSNTIPFKIPKVFFAERKTYPRTDVEFQAAPKGQTNSEK